MPTCDKSISHDSSLDKSTRIRTSYSIPDIPEHSLTNIFPSFSLKPSQSGSSLPQLDFSVPRHGSHQTRFDPSFWPASCRTHHLATLFVCVSAIFLRFFNLWRSDAKIYRHWIQTPRLLPNIGFQCHYQLLCFFRCILHMAIPHNPPSCSFVLLDFTNGFQNPSKPIHAHPSSTACNAPRPPTASVTPSRPRPHHKRRA